METTIFAESIMMLYSMCMFMVSTALSIDILTYVKRDYNGLRKVTIAIFLAAAYYILIQSIGTLLQYQIFIVLLIPQEIITGEK